MRIHWSVGLATLSLGLALSPTALAQPISLERLIPEPLDGTARVESRPPILDITNADEVHALDYVEDNGLIRAGILLALTSGDEPFDHNRKTCRLAADGAALVTIFESEFSGLHFYDVVTKENGRIEHATQFIIHTISPTSFVVDARYLAEQYAPNEEASYTITVQIWAPDPFDTITLAKRMLQKLAALGTVSFRNTGPLQLPRATIQQASHFDDQTTFSVVNDWGNPQEVLFEVYQFQEPGTEATYLTFRRIVNPGETTISFDSGPMSSLLGYSVDEDGFRDQIYLGRPFGYFSDKESGGTTWVEFDNRNCAYSSQYARKHVAKGGFLVHPGCAKITGLVDKWAGLFLPIGSFVGEWFNLREKGYKGVRFWARASVPFRVQIEDIHVEDFDFHGADSKSTEQGRAWREYTILFDRLAQRGFGEQRPFTGEVDQLSWVIDPPDGEYLPFELSIDRVTLFPGPKRNDDRRADTGAGQADLSGDSESDTAR